MMGLPFCGVPKRNKMCVRGSREASKIGFLDLAGI